MSLRPYVGEYLISPVPLHFGMNYCSHGCFYCFANLNNPDRRMDNTDLRWLSRWNGDDSTIVGWFLAHGYPILVSNDSDPLAASNEETFRSLHEICTAKNIPICYQTKGGKPELEKLILDSPPTMIYISITSDREDICAAAEPGAPGFAHRMNLAIEAKRRGHHVVIGINPMVSEWWNNFEEFCRRMAEIGIRHFWTGPMHLNYKQVAQMPLSHKNKFKKLIKSAQQQYKTFDASMTLDMEEYGIHEFRGYVNEQPGFWNAYFDLGFPFFPTIDGWMDFMKTQAFGEPVEFALSDFDAWADIGCDLNKSAFKEYTMSFGKSARNNGIEPKANNFREVHEWYFKILDYYTPFRHNEIYLSGITDNGILKIISEDGADVLVYAPGRPSQNIIWDVSKYQPYFFE